MSEPRIIHTFLKDALEGYDALHGAKVVVTGDGISVYLGNDSEGEPRLAALIEVCQDQPRVIVYDDAEQDEPSHIVPLK